MEGAHVNASFLSPFRIREFLSLAGVVSTPFVRYRLLTSVLLVFVSSALSLAVPLALKAIIDRLSSVSGVDPRALLVYVGLYVLGQWTNQVLAAVQARVSSQAD